MDSSCVIIPFRNASNNWRTICDALNIQSVMPSMIYVVCDRVSHIDFTVMRKVVDSSSLANSVKFIQVKSIPEYIGNPLDNPEADIFLAGHCRNIAVRQAMEDGCDVFIFIDGDCVPDRNLVRSHIEMNRRGVPNLSIGRRRDERHGWRDQREIDPNLEELDLFGRGHGRIVNQMAQVVASSIVWTCNTSMNRTAIERIIRMNEFYYGRGELFNSSFAGSWGGEDGFLGVQALMCSILITVLTDDHSGIRHIDHPRPPGKYDPAKFKLYFETQIKLLNEMQANKPMTMETLAGLVQQ